MSYQALARKWRPRRFAELVGQEHVVRALGHALAEDRLHHALLFSGTRGIGKTTLARIIARCLNCEQGVTAEPCGVCTSCREIEEGRFVDLIEVDAASRTGVDDVREMLDNVQYAPARGRRKVYLIDEVHMFSKSAFNALLKTLEEPPARVQFLLATTDPQKLPVTILSRCLQFHLRRLPLREIQAQLQRIVTSEGISFEPSALSGLAQAADGSMRDALSLLDQAIVYGGGTLRETEVRDMLGTLARTELLVLLRALAAQDARAMQAALAALDRKAPDYDAVLEGLAALLQRLALLQLLPDAAAEDGDDPATDAALLELAAGIAPEDVQLCYQIAISGRRDLEWAPDPRSGTEMTLLRMLAFRPADAPPPARRQTVVPAAATPPQTAAAAAAPAQNGSDDWTSLLARVQLRGMTAELARHCVCRRQDDRQIELLLDPAHASLLTDGVQKRLEEALRQLLGPQLRLKIAVGEGVVDSPAQRQDRQREAQHAEAEAAIASDPTVQALQGRFGARVRPGSVEPLD